MDLGTQTSPSASDRSAELISGQLHGFGISSPLASRSKAVVVKKNQQPSVSEYQQLVHLLQKRLKQTETENRTFRDQQKRLSKRCRIQRTLIAHLREQVSDQRQKITDFENRLFLSSGIDSQETRTTRSRVVSLNSALLRISGVEVPTEPHSAQRSEFSISTEAIDLEEFQPIEDIEDKQALSEKLYLLNRRISLVGSRAVLTMCNQFKAGVEKISANPFRKNFDKAD